MVMVPLTQHTTLADYAYTRLDQPAKHLAFTFKGVRVHDVAPTRNSRYLFNISTDEGIKQLSGQVKVIVVPDSRHWRGPRQGWSVQSIEHKFTAGAANKRYVVTLSHDETTATTSGVSANIIDAFIAANDGAHETEVFM